MSCFVSGATGGVTFDSILIGFGISTAACNIVLREGAVQLVSALVAKTVLIKRNMAFYYKSNIGITPFPYIHFTFTFSIQ
mgnify:CR=1 FL=1|jgi:hypothetical protein